MLLKQLKPYMVIVTSERISPFFFCKAAEYAGVTDSARRLIGSMSRRESRQKFLAIFILVVLVVVAVLLIYYNS